MNEDVFLLTRESTYNLAFSDFLLFYCLRGACIVVQHLGKNINYSCAH